MFRYGTGNDPHQHNGWYDGTLVLSFCVVMLYIQRIGIISQP